MKEENSAENLLWQKLIPGCFGDNDLLFANHPTDAERAKKMFHFAMISGVKNEDILAAVKNFYKMKMQRRKK